MNWLERNLVLGLSFAGEGLVSNSAGMPYCKPISENNNAIFDLMDNTFLNI